MRLVGAHARPVERTGVDGGVAVLVHDVPSEHHGFVHHVAVGIDVAREVVTKIVGVHVGPSVDGAGCWAGVVSSSAVVEHVKGVRVGVEGFPHHGGGVVPTEFGREGEVVFTLGGQRR